MRRHVWGGLAACLFLVGCSGRGWEEGMAHPPPPDLDAADKFEVEAHFAGGIQGALCSSYKLVLHRGGPCRATVTRGALGVASAGTTADYELPAEAFEECRALLRETGFWSMKSAEPEFRF